MKEKEEPASAAPGTNTRRTFGRNKRFIKNKS